MRRHIFPVPAFTNVAMCFLLAWPSCPSVASVCPDEAFPIVQHKRPSVGWEKPRRSSSKSFQEECRVNFCPRSKAKFPPFLFFSYQPQHALKCDLNAHWPQGKEKPRMGKGNASISLGRNSNRGFLISSFRFVPHQSLPLAETVLFLPNLACGKYRFACQSGASWVAVQATELAAVAFHVEMFLSAAARCLCQRICCEESH